ncbi:MAG: tRNA (guanosine(37)-N1)-methyltransferase TrmD [Gammaproteobacteria bacterium]|nr:tRNA (guanosine(37)-N1)-methyltransferase TrmD [Gammaproteobacteria bacterium]
MWFGIVSLFPEMFDIATQAGVLGRAVTQGVVNLEVFNPREFVTDKHRTVDDRPYGGGPGMVMMVEPLTRALQAARKVAADRTLDAPVVYLSPQGDRLDQRKVANLARYEGLILLAGRYEGVDERVIEAEVDEELSIGDYVLTGGELPAMIVMDAISRLLPGTLGNAASALEESHLDGLLDYPHYTRPENTAAGRVPPVLLGGDHAAVRNWRRKEALRRTWQVRPDMLAQRPLSDEERKLLAELFDLDLD